MRTETAVALSALKKKFGGSGGGVMWHPHPPPPTQRRAHPPAHAPQRGADLSRSRRLSHKRFRWFRPAETRFFQPTKDQITSCIKFCIGRKKQTKKIFVSKKTLIIITRHGSMAHFHVACEEGVGNPNNYDIATWQSSLSIVNFQKIDPLLFPWMKNSQP